ncbi:MAG: hypothetical protein JWO01_1578, partial [Microbacteriaceae bacterium]|nr:hypothetical protein [Microbacteriaceae bacterium]
TEHISAHYDNGVLSLMIPMSERTKPRKVAITAGDKAEARTADDRAAVTSDQGARDL